MVDRDREYVTFQAAKTTQSSLAFAVNNIAGAIQTQLDALPDDWHLILLWDFLVPIAVTLLLCSGGLYLLRALFRVIFPPTAAALHQEGLQELQAGRNARASKLLREAVSRSQFQYTPAVLSLAAWHVYRQKEPLKSLEILNAANESLGRKIGDEPLEFQAVRRDAEAILAGNETMVMLPLAESEFLTVLNAVAR